MTEVKSKSLAITAHFYLSLVVALLITLAFSIFNGYPILYSDTSTYLSSGFELEAPFDRPITYGILLRLLSFGGLTFTLVPLFQALILFYVLYRLLKTFIQEVSIVRHVLLLIVLLSLFTGYNWSLNQLIPDFLTPLGFLCLISIFYSERPLRKDGLVFFLFFMSAASHISNLFLYLFLLTVFFIFRKKLQFKDLRHFNIQWIICLVLLIVSYLIMASAIAKSRHVMFAGSMAQKGILQEVLRDNCKGNNFHLCRYKDSIPLSFEYFVWKESSPLYKIGGWKKARPELKALIGLSFSKPKYISMHLKSNAVNFCRQLVAFDVGDGNGAFDEKTLLIQRIQKYSILDDSICQQSMQSKRLFLDIFSLNIFYRVSAGLLLIILLSLLIIKRKILDRRFLFFVFFTFLLILASAFLVGFSSEVSSRHGCKLIWLIALLDFLLLTKTFVSGETEKRPT